mmetsp:Transcript_56026/g.149462  ORF Transcript_56026/g.149462 Transcript_56026/m.149462 type:complete len:222 (-) Transcript_56026:1319-1984(-)
MRDIAEILQDCARRRGEVLLRPRCQALHLVGGVRLVQHTTGDGDNLIQDVAGVSLWCRRGGNPCKGQQTTKTPWRHATVFDRVLDEIREVLPPFSGRGSLRLRFGCGNVVDACAARQSAEDREVNRRRIFRVVPAHLEPTFLEIPLVGRGTHKEEVRLCIQAVGLQTSAVLLDLGDIGVVNRHHATKCGSRRWRCRRFWRWLLAHRLVRRRTRAWRTHATG